MGREVKKQPSLLLPCTLRPYDARVCMCWFVDFSPLHSLRGMNPIYTICYTICRGSYATLLV